MLTTSWSRPASQEPGRHLVVEQQRVGRHLGAQSALLGQPHHVEEPRMQQRLAEAHEGHALAGRRRASPSATASNVAHSMKPSGSSQEWRTQVAQARLQAFVGST